MAKSTGNFLTLSEAVEKYSADGMRFGLADAGDTLDDANFSDKNANAGILRLYTQVHWVQEVINNIGNFRTGPKDQFFDGVFESYINKAIEETDHFYSRTQFREAIRTGFHDLQNARDHYRAVCEGSALPMHADLLLRFIEVQAVLIAPVCPHFAEKLWRVLKKEGSVLHAKWPTVSGVTDKAALDQDSYLEDAVYSFRNKIGVFKKKAKSAEVTEAEITVSLEYPAWVRGTLEYLQTVFDVEKNALPADNVILDHLKIQKELQPHMKKMMSLIIELKNEIQSKGVGALQLKMPFDEKELLEASMKYITYTLEVPLIKVVLASPDKETTAVPGKPAFAVTKHT